MIIKKGTFIIAVALLSVVPFLSAQQAPAQPPSTFRPTPSKMADPSKPKAFYRLDFVIREMEGEKIVDTRNYSLWVQAGKRETMTAGSEVPYSTGQGKTNYRNIGISISCALEEGDGSPWLSIALDISSIAPFEKGADLSSPVFRSTSFSAKTLITLDKSTMISSVDDPATKRKFQVNVTATKLK